MPTRWEVTKAVRASDLPAPSRLVMLVLADVAEVGTAEIPQRFTPSLAVLARETGLGRSTVAEHLGSLEGSGWVVRERPDDAGMARGDRTRYRLTIPAGDEVSAEGEGPDAEDRTPVQEPDGGSPGAGTPPSRRRTGVVQEPDRGSPGAGQPYKEVRSTSDQSDLFGSPPPAPTPNGRKVNGSKPDNAGTILASFIDYCDGKGVNIKTLRGQYAKTIKEALDVGHQPTFIKAVLAQMVEEKIANRPSLLRNRLVEAQTGPERRQRSPSHQPYRDPANQDAYDAWTKGPTR